MAPSLTPARFEPDAVTLIVGHKEEELLLHRSHIEKSRFLKPAFKEEWARGARELRLPEDDVEDLRGYLHFLYVSVELVLLANSEC